MYNADSIEAATRDRAERLRTQAAFDRMMRSLRTRRPTHRRFGRNRRA
jgi:hypothetical protein